MSNGAQAKQDGMDRAGELPLERRIAERRAESPAMVTIMADTIVALKEQLAAARGAALEEAIMACYKLMGPDAVFARTLAGCIAAIRALAAQPADLQAACESIDTPEFGSLMLKAFNGRVPYAKVVQYIDSRRPAALATTRPSAELVSLVNGAINAAFSERPVIAMLAQKAIKPFLPELTRPSAALTDEQARALTSAALCVESYGRDDLAEKLRAILAASGGALAVPDGWINAEDRLPGEQGQDSEEVLVFLNGHCSLTDMDCRKGGGWGIRLGWYDADKGMFRAGGRLDCGVTHWANLPAAPAIPAQGQTK